MPLIAAVVTDPGRVRARNEDAACWDPALRCALVLDGMGGHAGGSEASQVGIEAALRALREANDGAGALRSAHAAIVACAEVHPEWKGMGATGVLARLFDRDVEISWVGDSRGYLYRSGRLTLLTRDHSLVEALVQRGELDSEEARRHPQRNVVTRSLGIGDPVPGSVCVRVQPGDVLLLCSDGLSDELDDEQIATVMSRGGRLQERADALVSGAKAAGGRDNISVVLVELSAASVRGEALRAVLLGGSTALIVALLVWMGTRIL